MTQAVLIHGLGCTSRSWQRVVPLLEERFDVVPVDLPREARSIEDMAAHVASLDVSDAVVAGHSMGGLVAVALAESAPAAVARLVLINAPPTYESRLTSRGGPERVLRVPVVGQALWKLAGESRLRDGLASAFAPGFEVPDVFVEDLQATPWATFAGATKAVDRYLSERPLAARLGAVPTPATVLFGEEDQRVDPASLGGYDGVPGVEVERLPGVGHTPIWEAPEAVAEAIAARA
jgi:pimeloyl-ACP methyl ester carboxylesterase